MTTTGDRPRIAVITFPGSNDDGDAALALDTLGAEAVPVWHAETVLPGVTAVVLPGGFSYGDYLRCGAIARFAPIMAAVGQFAASGGPVLGICNGFQILCESGLLPGALQPNESLHFVARDVAMRVERDQPPFTSRCELGQRLVIPVKHGEGRYVAPSELLAELEQNRQVVLRYEPDENPNGSVSDIAGVVNAAGNVMGLMPHPEHAVDPLLGSTDGRSILGSLIDAARVRAGSSVTRFSGSHAAVLGLAPEPAAVGSPARQGEIQ
jgi:phosphoribosylformylglycinamidine synthase